MTEEVLEYRSKVALEFEADELFQAEMQELAERAKRFDDEQNRRYDAAIEAFRARLLGALRGPVN